MYEIKQVTGADGVLYTPAIETIKAAQVGKSKNFDIEAIVRLETHNEQTIVIATAFVSSGGGKWSAQHVKSIGKGENFDAGGANAAQTIAVAKALKLAGVGLELENAIATFDEMEQILIMQEANRLTTPQKPLKAEHFMPKQNPDGGL